MLSFFKINDPYRIGFILLIVLLVRLPLFYSGVPMIIPELKWMLIGEAVTNGGVMYKDIWDFTGPLATGVYGLVHLIFGKSIGAYRTLCILLVVIQSFIFNNLLLKNKALNQNTYVPALMYVLFMHISFDFLTLSPVIMGMTFTLLGINHLFQRMDNTTRDNLFVQIGLYLGVATLFYLPFFFYFVITIISLLLYTGSILRRMMLMIYGFLLVMILCSLYYYWFDSFSLFYLEYFRTALRQEAFNYYSWQEYIGLIFIPLGILLISIFKTKTLGRFINFQIKIQNVILMFLLSGLAAIWITKERGIYPVIYIVPGLAFFASNYLIELKNWIVSEVTLVIMITLISLNLLIPLKQWMFIDQFVSHENLIVKTTDYDQVTKGKSLLVIGDDIELYKESSLATPYLNWSLSKAHLENLTYYDNLAEIYRNFNNSPPEVIIDQKNVIPKLFDKMPTIALMYSRHVTIENVYLRK